MHCYCCHPMPISLTEKRHLLWLKQTCARSTESGPQLWQCHSSSRSQTVPENGGQHVSRRQQFPPRGLSEGLSLRMNKLFWHPFCGKVKIPWLILFLSQIIMTSCLYMYNLQIATNVNTCFSAIISSFSKLNN